MPEQQPMVVVRGEAVREVPPEIAVCTVAVAIRDKDKQVVLGKLAERAAAVRAALDGLGDAIERRETGVVQVFPEVKRDRRTVGYTGRVSTVIHVTDFAALGDMLLDLAALEEVQVSGPWWQLRPGSRAGSEARREAIADALARAREYAEAVGARVDRLIEIADEGTGAAPMAVAAFGMSRSAADESLALDPQPQTVQAAVVLRVAITEPDLAG